MRALLPMSIGGAVFLAAATGPLAAQAPATELDLSAALGAADSAEVYILREDLQFAIAPSPLTVRTLGCRYAVRRNSNDWRELRGALGNVVIRPASRPSGGEIRVGLVLSDRRGILFEAYSTIVGAGTAPGLSQRQEVEISSNFAQALSVFASFHANLASWLVHPMRICPPGSGSSASN